MIPRPPTASGTTDSLAPYVVGALAAGSLAGLGPKIRDALTYLGLVLSGAWVLADIWQAVQDNPDEGSRKKCQDRWFNEDQPGCSRWAAGNKAKHACCMNLARDRYMNCYQGRGGFPLLPWEAGYEGVC